MAISPTINMIGNTRPDQPQDERRLRGDDTLNYIPYDIRFH